MAQKSRGQRKIDKISYWHKKSQDQSENDEPMAPCLRTPEKGAHQCQNPENIKIYGEEPLKELQKFRCEPLTTDGRKMQICPRKKNGFFNL